MRHRYCPALDRPVKRREHTAFEDRTEEAS
jgi:hypothetical protein